MILIKGGLVKPMTGSDIKNGQILIDGAKIVEVGRNIDVPADVQVIDASGCIISPGFIDGHCHVGLHEEGVGRDGSDSNEIGDPVSPQIRGRDGINPFDIAFSEAAAAGITTAVTGPGSANSIGGTFLAIKTYGNSVEEMTLRDPVAMKCAFGENPKRVYGGTNKLPYTRMGNVQNIRECIIKAREYKALKEAAKGDVLKQPRYNAKLEAMQPVINREIPLKAHCHRADDIQAAIRLAKEMDVEITLDHCTEGYMMAEQVAASGFGVLAGPTIFMRNKYELKNLTYDNYRILNNMGIKFGIITDHPVIPLRFLPICAGLAIKFGLPEETAWKAITINAAQIVGIADRIGSIEPGKDADIAIFRGNPLLESTAHTMLTVINGKIAYKSGEFEIQQG